MKGTHSLLRINRFPGEFDACRIQFSRGVDCAIIVCTVGVNGIGRGTSERKAREGLENIHTLSGNREGCDS